jgi:hypothetical protein
MITDIKPEYQECLGIFEAFRKLGYKSDDIYFVSAIGGDHITVYIMLKAEGKEFTCVVGPMEGSREEIEKGWVHASNWWNTTTDSNRREVWLNSGVYKHKFDFLMALHAKGFTPADNKLN